MLYDVSALPRRPANPIATSGVVFEFDGRYIADGPRREFWRSLPTYHKRVVIKQVNGLRAAKLISEEAWKLWSEWNGQDETPQRWVKRVKEKGGTHTSSGSKRNGRESKDVSKVGAGNKAMSKAMPTSCAKTMGQQ